MSQFVHSLPPSFIILSVTPQQHGRVGSFFDNHSTCFDVSIGAIPLFPPASEEAEYLHSH